MTTKTATMNDSENSAERSTRLAALYYRLSRPAENETGSVRALHPGDILYWLTCLGAACLLLFAAT